MNKDKEKILLEEYDNLLFNITNLIQSHRVIAINSIQNISNELYWKIGEIILEQQQKHGWGKSVIELLSKDLNHNLGSAISWSSRNLWFMRQLVYEYSNLKQAVSEMNYLKELVLKVPWGHNILILQKVKSFDERKFYLESTINNRYSRSILLHQIQIGAYSSFKSNLNQNNFNKVLPENILNQAKESIHSIYSLDFLDIKENVTERELESSIVEKIKRVIMELGYGFCFIANQYRIILNEKEYFLDLLFYHRILKCLVVVELKVKEFEPEFIGKLDFYLQLVDDQLKQADDNGSIGILLVPYKNKLEVEYALRSASKPIGVAKYVLKRDLPKELKGKLPTKSDFEKVLK